MFKKKINTIIAFTCMVLHTTVFAQVENSIVPIMEKYEKIENIPMQKLSANHFNEISAALGNVNHKVRIVTFNLLCDDRENNSEEINKWHNRLSRVVELFNEMQPDIICVQEQYQRQLDALLPRLGDHYSFYGSPRGDGEVNGVIYRNDRFQLIQGSVITIPSQGRPKSNTVTMAQLKDSKTDKLFAVFNTHMTFSSNNEREWEAEFITKEMSQVAQSMPVILTGDLNMFPCHLEESFPYFDGDNVHRILTKDLLKDSQQVALLGHVGPLSTFTNIVGDNIPFRGLGTPGVMLDRIYVGPGIEVLIHAVQSGTIEGHFPSDHMPVIVDIISL